MIRPLALLLCLAGDASAQDAADIGGGTTVFLRPSEEPDAVAEVTMFNVQVNSSPDERDYTLHLGSLQVTVAFDWDANMSGDDRMTVTVPPGYYAVPEWLDVPEYGTGTIYIYPGHGVGM